MKILLGTTNPSKVNRFSDLLKGCDVEFVTLKDLAITAEPEENGTTPEENAILKAKFMGSILMLLSAMIRVCILKNLRWTMCASQG